MEMQDKECTLQSYNSDFVFMLSLTFSYITLFNSRKIQIKNSTKNRLHIRNKSCNFILLALIFFMFQTENYMVTFMLQQIIYLSQKISPFYDCAHKTLKGV